MTDHDWGKVGIGSVILAFFGIEAMFFGLKDFGLVLIIISIIGMVISFFFHDPY